MNNKLKNSTEVRKTLVRNPQQPVPKTVTVKPAKSCKIPNSSKIDLEDASGLNSLTNLLENVPKVPPKRFNVPEMHSTLKFSNKIDDIVKPRRIKSLPEVQNKTKKEVAVNEKVSRKVNFAYNEPVFKDLIPLSSSGRDAEKKELVLHKKLPHYQKDKEPVLTDYLTTIKKSPVQYYYKPKNPLSLINSKKPLRNLENALKLYKILQLND